MLWPGFLNTHLRFQVHVMNCIRMPHKDQLVEKGADQVKTRCRSRCRPSQRLLGLWLGLQRGIHLVYTSSALGLHRCPPIGLHLTRVHNCTWHAKRILWMPFEQCMVFMHILFLYSFRKTVFERFRSRSRTLHFRAQCMNWRKHAFDMPNTLCELGFSTRTFKFLNTNKIN